MPDNLTVRQLKRILIGRDVQFLDKAIYALSRGKSSGWVLGNKLRTWNYGTRRGTSNVPVVFIGCFPRSGSTLLRAILQSHPDIAASQSEVNLFQDIRTTSRKTKMNIVDAFSPSDDVVAAADASRDLVAIADLVLGEFLTREGARIVLVKQPKHIFFVRELFSSFPNAKFIHIVRDGRDATMSQRFYLLPEGRTEWPYEWCCRQWNVCINRGKLWRGDPRYVETRYEDLLQDSTTVANKLFEFVGVSPLPPNQLENFHEHFDKSKHPRHHDVANKIDPGRVNKWIDRMTDADREVFARIAGANNADLGYGCH